MRWDVEDGMCDREEWKLVQEVSDSSTLSRYVFLIFGLFTDLTNGKLRTVTCPSMAFDLRTLVCCQSAVITGV